MARAAAASALALAALLLALAAPDALGQTMQHDSASHTAGVLQGGKQRGTVRKLGPLDAYVTMPLTRKLPSAAVVIFTDIFGWEFNNTRLWADRLAADGGYVVVIPDFFLGEKLSNYKGPTAIMDFVGKVNNKARVTKDYAAVVESIKKSYPSVTKIGQQGFCWGGLFTALLTSAQAPRADAAVGFHSSLLKPADIDAVTGPTLLIAADPKLDQQMNTTFYAYTDKVFAAKRAKGLDTQLTQYPGMAHGFALRGDSNEPAVKAASTGAFEKGAAFLAKYLK